MRWSVTIPLYAHVTSAISAVPEDRWVPIDYPDSGGARVADTTVVSGERGKHRRLRLVVRRTRLSPCSVHLSYWAGNRRQATVPRA